MGWWGRVCLWIRACRLFALPASAMPVLIGAAAAYASGVRAEWRLLPFFLTSAVLIHTATNLFSDYFDDRRGVDAGAAHGSSGVLREGLLKPGEVFRGGVVLLGAALAAAVVLIAVRGWPICVLGVAGVLAGYAYTGDPVGYKYRALGEIGVFLFMGVLLVTGSFYAVTGQIFLSVAGMSLPVAALGAAILYVNNMRDIGSDSQAGVVTLAGRLGARRAWVVYAGLIGFAYLWTFVVITAGGTRWLGLVALTLPFAFRLIRAARESGAAIVAADRETARLHACFSLLQIMALVMAGAGR